jgi:mono/diheme cytochrome c family protein
MTGCVRGYWFVIATLVAIMARAANAADDRAAGKKLYTAKCARCHQFYDPAKYNDESWKTWMGKMRRKARLNDEQYRRLSEYLQSIRSETAKQVSADTTR